MRVLTFPLDYVFRKNSNSEMKGWYSCSVSQTLEKERRFKFCFGGSFIFNVNASLLNISIWRGHLGIMLKIPLASLWTEFLVPNTGRRVCYALTLLKGLNKWFFWCSQTGFISTLRVWKQNSFFKSSSTKHPNVLWHNSKELYIIREIM